MHVKRLIDLLNKDEGSGLILALMTLMVLSVLGASLGAITFGSYKLGDVNRDDNSAYYIAEAGANIAYEEMEKGVLAVYETSVKSDFFNNVTELTEEVAEKINVNEGDIYYDFETQFGDEPTVTAAINKVEESDSVYYDIVSTGEVAGKTRTVNKNVKVTWTKETEVDVVPETPVGAAVIANNKIDFKPNALVLSDVIVPNESIIIRGGNRKNEDVIKGKVIPTLTNWGDYTRLAQSFPKDSSTDFGKELINNINLSDSDNLFFYTDELKLGDLKINGNGIVNILVEKELHFTGDSFNLNNKSENVRIFFAGDVMNIDKDYIFNASLFVKDAKINFENKVTFNGVFLYGGNDNIELGVKSTFLDSYLIAPFAEVTLSNHLEFRGTLIASAFYIQNGASIKYIPIGSLPFSFKGTGQAEDVNSDEIISTEPGVED